MTQKCPKMTNNLKWSNYNVKRTPNEPEWPKMTQNDKKWPRMTRNLPFWIFTLIADFFKDESVAVLWVSSLLLEAVLCSMYSQIRLVFLAQNWKNEISKKCKNMKSGGKVTSCHHENAVCQRKSHLFTKKSTQIEYDIECTQNKTSIRKISNWNDWKQNTRDIGMSHKIYNCVVLCSII